MFAKSHTHISIITGKLNVSELTLRVRVCVFSSVCVCQAYHVSLGCVCVSCGCDGAGGCEERLTITEPSVEVCVRVCLIWKVCVKQ